MRSGLRSGAALSIAALLLSACGGGGGGGVTPVPTATPTVAPTPTPTPSPTGTGTPVPIVKGPDAADCPSTGSLPTRVARAASSAAVTTTRHESVRRRIETRAIGAQRYIPGLINITYTAAAHPAVLDRISIQGAARAVRDLQFPHVGLRSRVIAVNASRVSGVMAQLRGQPGIRSVEQAQYRRRMAITANDPYFVGVTGTVAPYFETDTDPGQWDMHVINLAAGWSLFSTAPVVGKSIAVIDTGVDVTHPELGSGKIVRTGCFVTYPTTQNVQSSGPYVTDTDGHGTNVAGIADENTNNNFAFAGVGFGSPLYAYRIFPSDPAGGCEGSSSAQCSTTDVDEVSAIEDAVNNGAKIINLSLGATGPLSSCVDSLEENAIENAISAGVTVVAAAGNEQATSLDCPAAYPGVIAVGATGLEGTGTAVTEGLASYSNAVSTGPQSGGGAFLLAPGGDPDSGSDANFLHWIENIYSSTAFDASGFSNCSGGSDVFNETGDCNILIAGTSQATPHVAGAAALVLAMKPNYTPAQVATALCSGADTLHISGQGCGRLDVAGALTYAMSH